SDFAPRERSRGARVGRASNRETLTSGGTLRCPRPFQPGMDSLWQDARLGLRTLLKAPLVTAAVVVTLGLGIGANLAVFTIVNRMLLKPLPVHDAGGLYVMAIQHQVNHGPDNTARRGAH